jgi:hypothetical protein
MKKKAGWYAGILFLLFVLAGCMGKPKAEAETSQSASLPILSSEPEKTTESAWFTPSPVPEMEEEGLYYYRFLTEEEKQTYRQMYDAVRRMRTEQISLVISNPERIAEIYQYILYDHPELFWMDHYNLYTYRLEERILGYAFEGMYTVSGEEKLLRQEAVLQKAKEILSAAPLSGSDYEKIKYVYEYVILNTEYDLQSADNQNICSVLLNGVSVCQGYALTVQYLLNQMGIACVTVAGEAGGDLHAWNLVWADGEPYYLDATWGDPQFAQEEDNLVELASDYISYEFLLVTTEEMEATHRTDNMYPVPVCTAREDNYYVQEGYYFETWSPEQLENLIYRCLEDGTGRFSVRCADSALYQELCARLLEEQKIYDYLWRVKGVTEAAFDANRILYGLDDAKRTIQFQLAE